MEGPLVSDDEGMVIDAALAGVGLAYLIEDQVASLLQAGALSRVLDDWCPPFPGFFLYYPGRRQVSPALAAFIDAIRVPAKGQKEPLIALRQSGLHGPHRTHPAIARRHGHDLSRSDGASVIIDPSH